ncbi:hypothetical protein [Nocardioides ganghwensis]|uniref:DUF4386 family protein n=1 Tax=Nocardioides ganghwensis TaxID=252230 RepID=A0A4Q2SCW2_9ACTN|nr:hypothetical protein [Nocardioides ganghwensis]MBD3946400.1 hypothetical protein [Nocardioides ganghwensis]RYC03156.1 hypothetical protein EUA07_06245 [Nocardioides ganghwensis]
MTIHHSPAPARSDVATPAPAGSSPRHPYAVHGRVLTAGALAWAATMAVVGIDPVGHADEVAYSLSSGLFQVGLLFLLRTLWRTQALGEGRLARFVLRAEAVAVSLAIGSTASDGLGLTDFDQVQYVVLDAFWPLSMLGMFLIGIRIAVAGRWTGATRFWPMVAESWAVVVIPTMGIFGDAVAHVVAVAHLVVGYGVLGVLVSRKTH